MHRLHEAKAEGYAGDDPDTWRNFRGTAAFGVPAHIGALIRLSDKYLRVQSLVADPTHDLVGEPIRDTLMDLAAYALITICLLEEDV